ncbi:Flp pilus assembly protein CpaB [Maribius pontilimi]|uniref:Flp pilus assembly protein CpaB n=1 Tax=Palleronia pontilimi TaxID=1964209 RepID=A0A934IAT5_9RHOB|nr:Flp pilus assembly protein CpaB [Palleronia pontilimi]MBJ3763658.1 Flp pilus assembly protein CpaB [Palleronia pontilimi]
MVAVVLAALAVFGARGWLASERQLLTRQITEQGAPGDQAPKNTIVVATESISFGERLLPNKVRTIEWSGEIEPDGAFKTIADLIPDDQEDNARFALTTMAAGEPILASRVTLPGVRAKLSTALTPGLKAVSIRVNDVLGVAGFVLPGDRVDILLVRGEYVDVLLQGVKVLAIDQIADDRKDQPSVVRTVTFEVNTEEAQKLVLAGNVGQLSLTLRNLASTEVEANERITIDDLSDLDVAENLLPEAELAAEPDADDERLQELEEMLRNMSDGFTDRLSNFEELMRETEPTVVERVVEVERVVPQPYVPPRKAVIGVTRGNGQRQEYRVDPTEAETYGVETIEEGAEQLIQVTN